MIQRYFKVSQAAAYLGIDPEVLGQWRRDGIGPPVIRITRISMLYDVQDLDTWLAGLKIHMAKPYPPKKRKKKPKRPPLLEKPNIKLKNYGIKSGITNKELEDHRNKLLSNITGKTFTPKKTVRRRVMPV